MPHKDSPIMSYGGEDDDEMFGGFCQGGHLNSLGYVVIFIFILLILQYFNVINLYEGYTDTQNSKRYPIKRVGKPYN